MSLEIRYLLHGQPDQYYDREPLYVVSQENSKWFNLGKKLLEIDQESWRLIDQDLSKAIPPTEYRRLNITTFTIDAIIEKIRKSGARRLSEINISDTDKEQLLIEIGQRGNNDALWKQLPFHKSKSGLFVSIDETTFLENADSDLSSRLKTLEQESGVKIIKRSESPSLKYLQEKEIPLWDSFSAMDILIQSHKSNKINIDKYSNLILYFWKNNGSDFKKNYKDILRETNWLKLSSGKLIAPKNILYLPAQLAKYTKDIKSLCDERYVLSDLSLSSYQLNPINRLFDHWNETQIIKFLLAQKTPSDYCQIIIDTLENLDDKDQILDILQDKQWLITESGSRIAPSQVVDVSKFKIEREAQEILTQANHDYVIIEMLDSIIKQNKPILDWLKSKLFIRGTQALEIIGDSAGELQSYSLGEFNQFEFPLEEALEVFEGIDADILPCWSLVEKIAKYNLDHCKTYIVLKILNPLESEVIINLLNWIREYKGTDEKAIAIYNQYLSLAVNDDNFYNEILPNILLLNRRLEWKSANQLAETTENIDESHLLNEEQEEILKPYLQDLTINEPDQQEITEEEEISDKEPYQLLQEYFGEWQTYVNDEAIGAFLCLIAGNDAKIRGLAQEFLLKRNFDDVLTRLIGTEEPRSFEITIQAKGENTKQLKSLTGDYFTAKLQNEENFTTFYVNRRLNETTQHLELVHINISTDTSNDKLVAILKESVSTLITKVYGIDSSSLPESFEEVWEDLNKSEQLDIKVTRGVILDSVESTIKFLGVHRQNQQLKAKIDEIDNAVQQREDFRNRNNQDKVIQQEKSINQLKQNLADVLEEKNSEIASATLEAVREKIGHRQFGYQETSVPFEIFQNADDALVELEMMAQNQPLDENRLQFFINCAKRSTIMMMYWGRPINCFIHPSHRGNDHLDKGFDKDLQKMLSFNYSDKLSNSDQPDSNITVTGKFGLGFKSIYLICREPHVLSHRLGFKVVGGLLPARLTKLNFDNLTRHDIKQFEDYIPQFFDRTIIKLPLDSNLDLKKSDILDPFEKLVGILLIFAKRIKTCKILINHDQPLEKYQWNPVSLLGDKTIEIGKITLNKYEQVNAICLKLDDSGHFVLPIKHSPKMSSALNKSIPNIWVTAPTQEKLELSFIVNAQFDVNTGRSTIIDSEDNLKLANKLGKVLGKKLCKLFELTQNNWSHFLELLQFQDITPYQFWEFIWEELAVRLLDKPETGSFGLIRKILGSENHGMGYFLIHCPALPNGLPEQYKCLVLATDIQYIIEGTLKEEKIFNQVWEWEFVKDNYPINQVIHGQVWEQFNKLLKISPVKRKFQVQSLDLPDILKCLLKPQKVTPNIADQIGELVTPDLVEELKFYRKSEHQKFINWLSETELKFLTQNQGTYKPIQQLLDQQSEDNEEKLLSAFAPPEYILSGEYTEEGLSFFRACRQKKYSENINANTLIDWIDTIDKDSDKGQKVIEYVLNLKFSQFKEELAEELRNEFPWIKSRTEIQNNAPSTPETLFDQGDQDDSTVPRDEAEKYRKIGEEKAVEFYSTHYDNVENQNHNNPENPGFDLECSQPKSPENSLQNIKVEVKAITYDRPYIRITQTEWDFMVKNGEYYELFIYAHDQGEIYQAIRIKKAWLTLKKILEKLHKQKLSEYAYASQKIQSIIGLQQNSDGKSNDILLHWHRLLKNDDHQDIELVTN